METDSWDNLSNLSYVICYYLGYCQGQSFLIAALLLQMPEEQAFGVLVQIMQRYGLRDMFR